MAATKATTTAAATTTKAASSAVRMNMSAAKITKKPKTEGQKFLAKARKAHQQACAAKKANLAWARKELKRPAPKAAATTTATEPMRPPPRCDGKIRLAQGPRAIYIPKFFG